MTRFGQVSPLVKWVGQADTPRLAHPSVLLRTCPPELVSQMQLTGLFELRRRFKELSNEIGEYRRHFAQGDIGGLIGSYKQLRHSRERFLRYTMSRQGPLGLVNATISFTRHSQGVASFLVPDFNFSQTFSFLRDIYPTYASMFTKEVFGLANNLGEAVGEKENPTKWENSMGTLERTLDVFLASWLMRNNRYPIVCARLGEEGRGKVGYFPPASTGIP